LFLAIVAALASADVESLADLLREFNHQNDVIVAYKVRAARATSSTDSRLMAV
jgi:hypothetical protein